MRSTADLNTLDGDTASAAPSDEAGQRPDFSFGPLAELVGFMLRVSQVKFFTAYFEEFEGDLRPGEISILAGIGINPGVRQGVLADAMRIKWSNMAKIVRNLDERGLLERRVPASDRRALELHLTDEGQAAVDRMLPMVQAHDRRAIDVLSDEERAVLLKLLARVAETNRFTQEQTP